MEMGTGMENEHVHENQHGNRHGNGHGHGNAIAANGNVIELDGNDGAAAKTSDGHGNALTTRNEYGLGLCDGRNGSRWHARLTTGYDGAISAVVILAVPQMRKKLITVNYINFEVKS